MESPGSLIDDVPSQKAIEGPAPNSLEALLFGYSDPSEDNHPAANLETPAMPIRTQDSVTSVVTAPTVSHAGSLELALLPDAADNLSTKDMVTTSAAENNQVGV